MQFHSGGALPALSTQEKFEKFKVPEKKGVATACNAQDTGMFLWPYKGNNAITDGCVAPLTMLLTIVIMYHKILSF